MSVTYLDQFLKELPGELASEDPRYEELMVDDSPFMATPARYSRAFHIQYNWMTNEMFLFDSSSGRKVFTFYGYELPDHANRMNEEELCQWVEDNYMFLLEDLRLVI